MKTFILTVLFASSLSALAGVVTRPMDDKSIDLAIALIDNHPGTFSIDGDCAKNEFTITKTARDYSAPQLQMSSATREYVVSEDEAAALDEIFSRSEAPLIDTGCGVKLATITVVGGGCGLDEAQQWSVSYQTLD